MKRLSTAEQRKLYNALPAYRKMALKRYVQQREMKGDGIKDIMKTLVEVLGPIARELGPVVMKEIIIPYLKKQAGLSGKGLRLAGQGKKCKKVYGKGLGSVRI